MGLRRSSINAAAGLCLLATTAGAQEGPRYVGAVAGVATLSADARSEATAAGADVSLYKPENGVALNVFAGAHTHEYVTLQLNYIWNRNDLLLVSAADTPGGPAVSEQPFASSQHAIVGDLLLFFRDRASGVRPYLSAGLGAVRLRTRIRDGGRAVRTIPPQEVSSTVAVLRVAVGLDLALGGKWIVRYSFSESISVNPIGRRLSPPGQRGLANFQNLIGILRAL